MTGTPHNFLVLFQPKGCDTVATMRVVDAWASSEASLPNARRMMMNNERDGQYSQHGEGVLNVVKQDVCRQFTYSHSREAQPPVTIDLTGPDWEPNSANRYYAQRGNVFDFGPTPEAALAALLKREAM